MASAAKKHLNRAKSCWNDLEASERDASFNSLCLAVPSERFLDNLERSNFDLAAIRDYKDGLLPLVLWWKHYNRQLFVA